MVPLSNSDGELIGVKGCLAKEAPTCCGCIAQVARGSLANGDTLPDSDRPPHLSSLPKERVVAQDASDEPQCSCIEDVPF